MEKLYELQLREHFKEPRNYGSLERADFLTEEYNPSCGDSIIMQGVVENGILVNLVFRGKGCVISQSTASMLTEFSIKKETREILAYTKDDILRLIGIPLGPNRLKCALLSLQALQCGLAKV